MEVQTLRGTVTEIVKYGREIAEHEADLTKLSSSMSDTGGNRTVEEVQRDIRALNEEVRAVRTRITTLEGEKENRRQTILSLERQISDIKSRLGDINMKLMESKTLNERIDECEKSSVSQKAIIENVDQQLQELAPQLLGAETKVEHVTRETVDSEKRQQREATKISQSALNMQGIQNRVQAYIDRGGPENLEHCAQQIRGLQKDVEKANNAVTKCGDAVAKMERDSSEASATERSITDNLRYRRGQRELEEILEEIETLEAENAEAHRDRFSKDADILANKHMRMSTEVPPPISSASRS